MAQWGSPLPGEYQQREVGAGGGTLLNGIPGQTAGNPHLQLSLAAFFPFHPPSHRGLSSGLRVLLRTPAAPPSPAGRSLTFSLSTCSARETDATAAATFTATPLVWPSPGSSPPTLGCTDGCISQVSWCVCRGTFVTDV